MLSSLAPSFTPPRAAPGVLILEPVRSEFSLEPLRLAPGRYTIGSGETCTLRGPSGGLASCHCLIAAGARRVIARAWDPRVALNGRPFEEAVLRVGDRLSVGPLEFAIVESVEAEAVRPRVPRARRDKTLLSALLSELHEDFGGDVRMLQAPRRRTTGTPVGDSRPRTQDELERQLGNYLAAARQRSEDLERMHIEAIQRESERRARLREPTARDGETRRTTNGHAPAASEPQEVAPLQERERRLSEREQELASRMAELEARVRDVEEREDRAAARWATPLLPAPAWVSAGHSTVEPAFSLHTVGAAIAR